MAIKKKKTANPGRAKSRIKKAARRPKARVHKGLAKKSRPAVKKSPELSLEKIGEITHYFPHVKAAAVLILKNGLKAGDNIYIKGHTTDFKEAIASMQLDHVSIQEAKLGQEIGLLVKNRVRIGDSVYRV